jgi:hypothetical protein
MTYKVKTNWRTDGALSNALLSASIDDDLHRKYEGNYLKYFKAIFNIRLILDASKFNYVTAEFESKEAYMLFILEWS